MRAATKLSSTERRLNGMRYWSYLAGKLAVSAAISYGLLALIHFLWAPQMWFFDQRFKTPRFGFDLPYTSAIGVWFLISCGLVALCVLDQRYRCRVCLRRLRMPILTGSWSRMLLLGRPRIEYICPYGHGTLKAEELQISGMEYPEWQQSGDMWEELCAAASKDADTRL